jgi:hypothetical protein
MNFSDLPLSKASMRRIKEPQEERQAFIKALDNLWGKIVRKRDKYTCQWCGSKKNPQAHHIISKPRIKRLKAPLLRWLVCNGVTLCKACHFYRLKDEADIYDAWVRNWLVKNTDKTFDSLLGLARISQGKADLQIVKIGLEQEAKAMGI